MTLQGAGEGVGAADPRRAAGWPEDEMPTVLFPADRPRGLAGSRPDREFADLAAYGLVERLRAFAAAERCPLPVVFAAGMYVVAERYTIAAGAFPVLPEGLDFPAFTVAIAEPQLDAGVTFRALVHRIAADAGPGRRLLTAADGSSVPVVLTIADGVNPGAPLNGVRGSELDVRLTASGGVLAVRLGYDRQLFDEPTVRRIGSHLTRALSLGVDRPDTLCGDLELLDPAELNQVTHAWNRTARPFPGRTSVVAHFAEQVRLRPEATAVAGDGTSLTYAALNARANQLAHLLVDLGIGPDDPVAVCLERSADMVVGLLGILKADGAYLPLDPAQPAERLAGIIADAGCSVVVSRAALAPAVPGVRTLSTDDPRLTDAPAADPELRACGDNLAYIIYTSGSTGAPNGVAVTHRALCRLVKATDYADLRPGDTYLQMSPITFDASLLELWGSLLNGGAIVLPSNELPFPEQLRVALTRHEISTLLLISPQLHVAAEQFPELLGRVRQLLVGGDVLSPPHAARLLGQLEDTRFIHVYGPTECTLFATAAQLIAVDPEKPTVPIGLPIANTEAYVLDGRQRAVPIGAYGELALGGPGLARGYINQPRLTAERFVPNPFGPPGSRLYRTGDLVRRLSTGDIEFVGRIDGQVKIRGYRIEIGEIETALTAHSAVREAAVVARNDLPGGKALVAYVVPAGADPPDAELRSHLRRVLPKYMLPAAFVRLPALPLNRNGKLDRKALPRPHLGTGPGGPPAGAGEGIVDSTMSRVTGIWQRLLGAESVAPEANFFEVGGNSLLLVDLLDQLGTEFPAAALPATEIYANPTPTSIAGLLDAREIDPDTAV